MRTNIHIIDGDGLEENALVTSRKSAELTIHYPLRVYVKVKVVGQDNNDGEGPQIRVEDVLNAIQAVYRKIYANQKKYGVWGHGLGDLYLEKIEETEPGKLAISIGS